MIRLLALLLLAHGAPEPQQAESQQSGPQPSGPGLPAPEGEAFHQAVAWSPDGEWIAYSEFSGGDFSPERYAIYVVACEGSEGAGRREVAKGVFCSWSPDGQRLVFDSRREGNWDLYVAGIDGGDLERLTEHEADDSQPAWSPTGDRIAFSSTRAGNREIYVLELEGERSLTRLTTNEAGDFNPAWSPDGESVVFFREKGDGKDQIHVVRRDGTGERRVTPGVGHHFYPSFLPDGRVGYTRIGTDGSKSLAWSRVDGSGLEHLADVPLSFARWSPEGERIAFISGRWPQSAVYVMAADGGGIRKLAN